jgi:L-ascorbate metabolism protein UlaG (beta-lactamase superfamily)
MRKKHLGGLVVLTFFISWFLYSHSHTEDMDNQELAVAETADQKVLPEVIPIEHASFLLRWDDAIIFNDPVGGAEKYAAYPTPTLVLLSDIHGDHLNVATLESVVPEGVRIIAPQAVYDELPDRLKAQTEILANDGVTNVAGIEITAVPMYNYPETDDSRHTKGRGNGYLLEKAGVRVYIAGDTAGTPEMKSMTGIDIAFVPMNLPYTMGVEEAAEAVIAFAPRSVYPYHYRTPEGFSDIARFKELVVGGNSEIEVVEGEWYASLPTEE